MASLLNWKEIEPIVKELAPNCSDYSELARAASEHLATPLNRRTLWDWAMRKLSPPPTNYFNFVDRFCFEDGERPQEPKVEPDSQYKRVFLRSAVFDIETTDLRAVGLQGYMLAGCILPLDSDEVATYQIQFEDQADDKRLLTEYLDALSKFDLLIGHNIAAFDFNHMHSRAMRHGVAWPRTFLVFDTYQVAKSLAFRGYKGLAMLCDALDIPCIKTSVYPRQWNEVRSWKREAFNEAMDQICYHCEQDVRANRLLFDALFPRAMSLPQSPVRMSKFRTG